MPIYEYKCSQCDSKFEELVSNSETKVICPECKSAKIEKVLSVFSASVGSSSSATPCGAKSCNSGFS